MGLAISLMTRVLPAALLGLALCTAAPQAAEVAGVTHAGRSVIRLTGEIKAGDYDLFQKQMDLTPGVDVELSSDGGQTEEALAIGRLIRLNKSTTIVPDGKSCASACGLIWLAGEKRVVAGSGEVGFHATYIDDDYMDVSPDGNALVGAYLAELGYGSAVIVYATRAEPNDMRWLTPADSQFLALAMEWRRPKPPNPNIVARKIVEYRLRNDRVAKLLKDNYQGAYDQYVSDAYAGDMQGQPWLEVLYHAANKLRLPLVDDRSLGTAIFQTYNRQYIDVIYVRFGGLLLSKNDETCYSLFKEVSRPSKYLFAGGPDDLQAAYLKWFGDALETVVKAAGKPLERKPITAADEAYGKRQLAKSWRKAFGQLSPVERHRLLHAKPAAEKVLRCKLYMGTLRAALHDPRLTRLLFQPRKFGSVAIDPPG